MKNLRVVFKSKFMYGYRVMEKS